MKLQSFIQLNFTFVKQNSHLKSGHFEKSKTSSHQLIPRKGRSPQNLTLTSA
jgi:N-acetyl-anhydromuramyl-L-alanine amidase AmpD